MNITCDARNSFNFFIASLLLALAGAGALESWANDEWSRGGICLISAAFALLAMHEAYYRKGEE